ncbi:MAG: BatD family protein [Spirochaetes bacterium]|nr:BatD family protein [Spirochaetota bacterium]
MRKYGSAIIAVAMIILPLVFAHAVEIDTELERSRIAVGEETLLQIKISGASSAEVHRIPKVAGLDIEYRGTSRSFQWINGKSWSGIVLSFAIMPQRSATFTIPPIEIRVGNQLYRSRPVQLVAFRSAVSQKSQRSESAARAVYRKTELSKSRVYVGEPILVRYFLLHHGIQFDQMPLLNELPETKWCVQRHMEERIDESIEKFQNLELVKTHLATFLLIPTMKGRQTIRGGEVVVSYVSNEGFFPFPRQARVNLEEAAVEVLPLPEAGKPKDFSGNVGNFTMEVEHEKKAIKVYDEATIKVIIRGQGNFLTMSPPVFVEPKGTKLVKGSGDVRIEVKGNAVEGVKEFIFTLIPERSGIIDAGKIQFNYFDPAAGMYRSVESERIMLTVEEEGSRGGINLDESEATQFDVNYVWIALIVLGIAALVGGMVYWERKKYHSFIKAREHDRRHEQRNESNFPEIVERFHREIILASSAKPEEFLKIAEKVLAGLERELVEKTNIPEKFHSEVQKIKERVYNIRYGGYAIGADEVKDISGLIRAMLREIKEHLQ